MQGKGRERSVCGGNDGVSLVIDGHRWSAHTHISLPSSFSPSSFAPFAASFCHSSASFTVLIFPCVCVRVSVSERVSLPASE